MFSLGLAHFNFIDKKLKSRDRKYFIFIFQCYFLFRKIKINNLTNFCLKSKNNFLLFAIACRNLQLNFFSLLLPNQRNLKFVQLVKKNVMVFVIVQKYVNIYLFICSSCHRAIKYTIKSDSIIFL